MRKTVKNGVPELWVEGVIVSDDDRPVYEWFGIGAVSPGEIIDALPPSGPVTIKVDSPGGNLIAGASIYTALMQHPGPVTFEIVGLAASAASVITMASAKAGNLCRMSPMALMMVHNVQGFADGDYRDMLESAEFLQTANQTIVNAYLIKTKKSEDEIRAMLDDETWFSAAEAMSAGLIDEIMFLEDEAEPSDGAENGSVYATAEKRRAKTLLNLVPVIPKQALLDFRERIKAAPANEGDLKPAEEKPSEETENARARIELERARF